MNGHADEAIGAAIVAIASAVGGWLAGIPQSAWRKLKAWRESRKAVSDGMKKLPQLVETVEKISYQVNPNGNGSMRDAVDRTEKGLSSVLDSLGTMKRDMSLNTAILKFQSDLSDEATFYMTPNGQITTASAALQKTLGVAERDLTNYDWKNYIAREDVVGFVSDMELCIRERRKFQRRVSWVRPDQQKVMTDISLTLYPEDRDQELQSLMGHVRPVTQ